MAKSLRDWGKQYWLTLTIWAGTLLVTNWIILTKPIFYTHDYLHGARISEFARAWREGQWPVIWSQNFGFGFGMPIFEFYAPLPYGVGAIFYLISGDLVVATKLLFVLTNVGTMVGVYLWAREFFDRDTASLAASLATLASYRAMDLFARGAMSELWGIMGVAWLVAGITQIVHDRRGAFGTTLAGGVILALSHNITLMLAAPLLLVYALGLVWLETTRQKEKKWRVLLGRLSVAALAIAGVTMFYWLPAFTEKDLTQVDTYILDDYFDFRLHFLYVRQFWRDNFGYGGSGWGPDDGLSFFLGWAQWAGLAVTGALVGVAMGTKWRELGSKKSTLCSQKMHNIKVITLVSILFLITIFMSLERSRPIWQLLASLLAFVQFPWRFLGIAIIWLALLAVGGVALAPKRYQASLTAGLWLLAVITSAHYFQGERYLAARTQPEDISTRRAERECLTQLPAEQVGAVSFYQDDPDYIRCVISPVLVDYLPRAFANYTTREHDGMLDYDWASVPVGTVVLNEETQPAVLIERMHEKLYQFEREASGEAELALVYYPGWTAQLDGQDVDIKVSERGNIVVALPVGQSRLGLRLGTTPIRRVANAASAVSTIIIVSYGVYGLWPRKK